MNNCLINHFTGVDPGFPMGGHGPILGSMDLQHGPFLVKMYEKMKELGPVGGCVPENFVCRSANASCLRSIRYIDRCHSSDHRLQPGHNV